MASLALLEGCQTYRPPAPTPGQLAQQQPRRPVRVVRPPAARNAQEPPAAAEAPGGETPLAENGPPETPAAGPLGTMPEQTAAAAPAPPAAPAAPQRITGWRAEDVRQRFGQPASQRTAGAARVWRYQGANCAVDVFFYYDTRQATFVALDQRLDGQAASPEACLATVGQPARAG
ncbi:MAG: hypothetical protein JNL66_12265 [Alphaproteobacteria bacterium]|nr:hypothetical protein [Alphaproteobacteria bacterium]